MTQVKNSAVRHAMNSKVSSSWKRRKEHFRGGQKWSRHDEACHEHDHDPLLSHVATNNQSLVP